MTLTLPDGIPLYYEILPCKNESAPWILWLNGLTQNTNSWKLTTPNFEQTHNQLLVDFVFQLQSGTAPMARSFDQHATDVAFLLEHLQLKEVNLAGISYGGAVALRLMHLFGKYFKKTVLISAFAYRTPLFDAIGESWAKALQLGGYPHMVEVMFPVVLGNSYYEKPFIPIEVLKNHRLNSLLSPDSILKLMQATAESGNYLSTLTGNTMPTLIIHGEEDGLCPPIFGKAIQAVLPNSTYHTIEKAGHTLNLEAIPQLSKQILQFI